MLIYVDMCWYMLIECHICSSLGWGSSPTTATDVCFAASHQAARDLQNTVEAGNAEACESARWARGVVMSWLWYEHVWTHKTFYSYFTVWLAPYGNHQKSMNDQLSLYVRFGFYELLTFGGLQHIDQQWSPSIDRSRCRCLANPSYCSFTIHCYININIRSRMRSLWLPAPSTQQRQWNLSSKSLCASNRSHRGHGEYEGLCAATAGIGAQGRKGSVPPVQLNRCTTCPLRILTTTSKRAGRLWPWRTQLDMSRHVIHAVSGGKFQVFQWTDVFYVPFWRSKRYHTVPSCLVSLVDMFATST